MSVEFEELANDADCNTEVGDMLLFNAVRCAELAGDEQRARSLREQLESDYPQSPFLEPRP